MNGMAQYDIFFFIRDLPIYPFYTLTIKPDIET